MIRTIVFDMGNVLLRYSPVEIVRSVLCSHPREDDLVRAVFGAPEWSRLDEGVLTDGEAAAAMAARSPGLEREIRRVMADWPQGMRPVPGMEELGRTLKKQGYGLYPLSNASGRFHEYCACFPVFSCFDGLHISADLRLLKPDPEIYRQVLELHDLRPEESLFIDDLAENVAGARAAGMFGLRFTDEPRLRADLEHMRRL